MLRYIPAAILVLLAGCVSNVDWRVKEFNDDGLHQFSRGNYPGARDSFASAVVDYDDRERTKFWAAHTSHNAGVTCRARSAD